MDLIIRDARLRGRADLADIGITGGRIEAIAPRIASGASLEIDAAGRLTTPSFVEPHIHLDKALTAERARENATNVFEDAIAIMREVKRTYTVEDVDRLLQSERVPPRSARSAIRRDFRARAATQAADSGRAAWAAAGSMRPAGSSTTAPYLSGRRSR